MLANVKEYSKLLKTVSSCLSLEHTEVTYNWATKLHNKYRITLPEYLEILRSISDKNNTIKNNTNGNMFH